ncbi:MAG: DUF3603 family protein [bacterium]|nr:DUF3603 family protein [bacterium]
MNYIYDILLNFTDSERLVEFYEWNENDSIEQIKKIPIYRISSEQMQDICQNQIALEEEFLHEIKNQAITYNPKNNIKYALLICDLNKALALEFDNNGLLIARSGLLLDEEEDIVETSYDLEETTLKYKIIRPYEINYYLTRKENFKKNYLLKELEYLSKNKNQAKLNYIYEEIFPKDNLSYLKKITRLIDNIKNNYNIKHNELYEIIRLTYIKK